MCRSWMGSEGWWEWMDGTVYDGKDEDKQHGWF
jgi:hypothetical protein